jgi:hypothetical protein
MEWRYQSEKNGAMLYIKNIMARYVNGSSSYVDGLLNIDWVSGVSPFGRYEENGIHLPPTNGEEVTGLLCWMAPNAEFFARYEFTGEKTETILFEVVFMGKTTFYSLTVTMRSL